jgi:hypothetical protein
VRSPQIPCDPQLFAAVSSVVFEDLVRLPSDAVRQHVCLKSLQGSVFRVLGCITA